MKSLTIITLSLFILLNSCKKETINTTYDGQVDFLPEKAAQQLLDLKDKTIINGSVYLSKTSIENFTVLNTIKKINGDLVISDTKITDLSFLSALVEVNGRIVINQNANLISTKGLEKVQKVKALAISGQNNTIDFNPIKNINVEEEINFSYLQNTTLPTFKNITNLSGELILENCEFNAMTFLPNLKTVKGYFLISNNPNFTSLVGLEQLISTGGDFVILGNNKLQTLEGLNNLQEVSKKFQIIGNKELKNISNLAKLNKAGIFMLGLSACENLNGLENLTNSAGITILTNVKMVNFCGIKPLLLSNTIINNQFYIMGNLQNPTFAEIKSNCQ